MIEDFINNKFPGDHPHRAAWRRELVRACTSFVESGLADPKFVSELLSGEEHKFWACLSEALIAQRLDSKVFPPRQ